MASTGGYSAQVALTLMIDGQQLTVSHVGHTGIMVSDLGEPIAACDATLIVEIDGNRSEHNIFLPEGLPCSNRFVRFF